MRPRAPFIVPLSKVVEVRDRFKSHARAAASGSDLKRQWEFVISVLSELISDTRAAGTRAPDGPTPADRAACRIIAVTAVEQETIAEQARRAAADQVGSHRQAVMGEAVTADAKARHLWHALMALMEHTGLDPGELDVVIPEPLHSGH